MQAHPKVIMAVLDKNAGDLVHARRDRYDAVVQTLTQWEQRTQSFIRLEELELVVATMNRWSYEKIWMLSQLPQPMQYGNHNEPSTTTRTAIPRSLYEVRRYIMEYADIANEFHETKEVQAFSPALRDLEARHLDWRNLPWLGSAHQ